MSRDITIRLDNGHLFDDLAGSLLGRSTNGFAEYGRRAKSTRSVINSMILNRVSPRPGFVSEKCLTKRQRRRLKGKKRV